MKVLIGVDGSTHSQAALDHVKGMPWPKGSTFVVLSASVPMIAYTVVDASGLTWMQGVEEEMTGLAQTLATRVEKELRDAGLSVESRVVKGDPRDALVDIARSIQADLLVVGSHGRTGLAKIVLGSVAAHVVTHAPCSVLVVKMKS